MARSKLDDLAKFQEYLVQNGIGERTANVYASRIRKMLLNAEPMDRDALRDFLSDPSNLASYSGYLTAWGKWRKYVLLCTGIELPSLGSKSEGRVTIVLPALILDCLIDLRELYKIPFDRISQMCWSNVELRNARKWDLQDPVKKGSWYQVNAELLRPIAEWIFGDEPIVHETVLIPRSPTDLRPVSAATLARLVTARRNSRTHSTSS